MQSLYKFMASIKLAIPLMLILTIAMITATIVESKSSTEVAHQYIYYHPWFTVLNTLIAINILLATIVRFPFKKSQTGFVITHTGLLLIFGGAIFTQLNGIDGVLVLREGGRSNTVEFRTDQKDFYLPFVVKLETFALRKEAETMALMDYESVISIDGVSTRISMNQPLKRDGFYLYQSSYQLDEKNGHRSIFSVGYDPGRPFKYAGSLFLCLGMAIMYWFKTGIFTLSGVRPQKADRELKGEAA